MRAMIRQEITVWTTAVAAVMACLGTVRADGYRNPPPTAAGIGRAGVNLTHVDDASALSYNPANLAGQTNASTVISATFARTEKSFRGAGGSRIYSEDPWNVLPNLYQSLPVGESGWVLGLALTTPFGQGLEWDSEDLYDPSNPAATVYESSMMMINVNPTVAFPIGEHVSLGVGVDIYYSELELHAVVPPGPVPAKGKGDDVAVGGNIGLTVKLSERQRLAFTYRSRFTAEYEGDFSLTGAPDSPFSMDIIFPNMLAVGYGIQLTETLQLEANVEWLEWSVNDVQKVNAGLLGTLTIENQWDDTFTAGVAADWEFMPNWTLRGGYAFIESPVPDETLSPILPDADRHVLSFGLGYRFGQHGLDLAYAFSLYETRTSADYEIDSDLAGLTYSFLF